LPKNEIGTEKNNKRSKIFKIIISIVSVLVLCFTLVYFNFIDNDNVVEYGSEVGAACYEYDLPIYGTEDFFNVSENKGKITIINFWGTWCTPCVAELLNEFPRISDEYSDEVTVVAVHSFEEYGVNVAEYISKNFSEMNYIFCRDSEGNLYCNMLGGGQAWPHTVIVDKDGVIRSVIPRATTYEELKQEIEKILKD
jgi:thiol-disulfide isomerase/thioredoxin